MSEPMKGKKWLLRLGMWKCSNCGQTNYWKGLSCLCGCPEPGTISLLKYNGKRGSGTFRSMTLEEAKSLQYGQHIWFRSISGDARECKVNGAPKTWKRDASRVEVLIKYGIYEYYTFNQSELSRLLVEVTA